ncbi:MAG: 50S ribosomal protein L23 [Planctomycetota bacterium]|nr:MAG: 50S ribosomal protein L23 [Planctomycetota bacterium]
MTADPRRIILRPLITEKGTDITTDHNGYTFAVARKANKVQIRQAIEQLFDVSVTQVRTMTRIGKIKGRGPRASKKPNWKRAIVTLAEGDVVEFL